MATEAMGTWIPLMDYAMKKGVSLSTLRRHIKAGKINHKIEQGRYLLWDNDAPAKLNVAPVGNSSSDLAAKLKKAHEEIAELKTLIAFYEENLSRGINA